MSGPLELYRTTVNLRGLGVGVQIEIDPMDPGWAGDIASKRIVPVVAQLDLAEERWIEGARDGLPFEPLPGAIVRVYPADGSEPYEVEGVVEHTNGDCEDGARWPVEAAWGGASDD